MFEVLLFSFSISIDAFGYSVGFGSKNTKLSQIQFLILNLINTGILTLFMLSYPKITFLFASEIVHGMSGYILLVLGQYNAFVAYRAVFVSLKAHNKKLIIKNPFQINNFSLVDLSSLMLIFIFENLFSTFIFYSTLCFPEFFIITSFCFHYLFFIVGFDLGFRIKKVLSFDTRFVTFVIFIFIGLLNIFE